MYNPNKHELYTQENCRKLIPQVLKLRSLHFCMHFFLVKVNALDGNQML